MSDTCVSPGRLTPPAAALHKMSAAHRANEKAAAVRTVALYGYIQPLKPRAVTLAWASACSRPSPFNAAEGARLPGT